MKKFVITSAIAVVVLGGSCAKNKVSTNAENPDKVVTSTISATSDYDYSQPVENVINDAISTSTGRVKEILTRDALTSYVIRGRFIGETTFGGSTISICDPYGSLCEIVITAIRPKVNVISTSYEGSFEAPVAGIQALPEGDPKGILLHI